MSEHETIIDITEAVHAAKKRVDDLYRLWQWAVGVFAVTALLGAVTAGGAWVRLSEVESDAVTLRSEGRMRDEAASVLLSRIAVLEDAKARRIAWEGRIEAKLDAVIDRIADRRNTSGVKPKE